MNEEIKVKTIEMSEQRYLQFLERERWLQCLEDAGVDNWDGIDHARELFREEGE